MTRERFLGQVKDGRIHDVIKGELGPSQDDSNGSWYWVEDGSVSHFAAADSALAEMCALAIGKGHDPVLPPECEAEAAAWVADPGIDDPSLTDLTHLPFVTIDYVSSKDLDQAVCVEEDGDGHIVWYALADAAYYVRPGTALFNEALRRGATMYLPGLNVPMLPRALCEGLVSINPQVDRRAMVFRLALDAHGKVTDRQILRGRVHSRAKLAYSGVQAWYDGGPAPTEDAAAQASLRALAVVGERRIRDAELRDVVRPRHAEVDVSVGGRGMKFIARKSLRLDVERYNEQISLMTNVEGARYLREGERSDDVVQPIFRTHAPPDEARLRGLQSQIARMVKAHALEDRWQWRYKGEQSLSDYLRGLPQTGVAGAIQRQALLTGGRSGFGAKPAPHHGVGAEVYARFTAPMREVVGVFVHKETWEKLGTVEPAENAEDVYTRQQVIEAANRSKSAQRRLSSEVNRMVLDRLFALDLDAGGVARKATVMGVGRGKVHVQLADPPIDVKVYRPDLDAQYGKVRVDKGRNALMHGERVIFCTGDTVTVQATRRDEERDRWVLEVGRE